MNQLGSSECASTINIKHLLYRCIYINFASRQRRPSNGVLLKGTLPRNTNRCFVPICKFFEIFGVMWEEAVFPKKEVKF